MLARCTELGFTIERIATQRLDGPDGDTGEVQVKLELFGGGGADTLATALGDVLGVHEVAATGLADIGD